VNHELNAKRSEKPGLLAPIGSGRQARLISENGIKRSIVMKWHLSFALNYRKPITGQSQHANGQAIVSQKRRWSTPIQPKENQCLSPMAPFDDACDDRNNDPLKISQTVLTGINPQVVVVDCFLLPCIFSSCSSVILTPGQSRLLNEKPV
jgi:hypothetical protein